jgi:hypothetical protein
MLAELVAAQQKVAAAGGGDVSAEHGGGGDGASDDLAERLASVAGGRQGDSAVPALPLGQLAHQPGGSAAPTTRRSGARDPAATARGVELELGAPMARSSGMGTGRTRARARFGGDGGGGSDEGVDEAAEREAARRGMDVSDSGSEGAGGGGGGRRGRRKPLTEEEREAELAAKGSRKARAWLDSGFHNVGQAVSDLRDGHWGVHGDGWGNGSGRCRRPPPCRGQWV